MSLAKSDNFSLLNDEKLRIPLYDDIFIHKGGKISKTKKNKKTKKTKKTKKNKKTKKTKKTKKNKKTMKTKNTKKNKKTRLQYNIDTLKIKLFFTHIENDLVELNINSNEITNNIIEEIFNIVKKDLNDNMAIYTNYDNKYKNAIVKSIKTEDENMVIKVSNLPSGYMKKNDFKDIIIDTLIQRFNPLFVYNVRRVV